MQREVIVYTGKHYQVNKVVNQNPYLFDRDGNVKDEDNNTSLEEYRFWTLEPSKEYLEWVEAMKGEVDADGETEYGYDVGIAP